MPQDDTWKPNRHHTNMQTFDSCGLNMSGETLICPLCRTLRMPRRKGDVWFWGCQNYPTCTAPTTATPPVPLNLKMLQRQDSSEGMPSPFGQALGQWHGKGKHVPTVWSHYQRQGREHWDQQGDPTATNDRREDASLQPDGGGTHRTGPGAGRDRRSEEIAGGSPFGSTTSPERSDRSSTPSGRGDGRNGQDQKPDGSEPGVSRSMKTSQKKRLLGGIKKTKIFGKDGMGPSRRRRDYRAKKKHHSTVHRFLWGC